MRRLRVFVICVSFVLYMLFLFFVCSWEHLLTVEGAEGHKLSYLEYVEVDITCADINLFGLSVIMLVVPNTRYHDRVPVLLSTNILGLLTDRQYKTLSGKMCWQSWLNTK